MHQIDWTSVINKVIGELPAIITAAAAAGLFGWHIPQPPWMKNRPTIPTSKPTEGAQK